MDDNNSQRVAFTLISGLAAGILGFIPGAGVLFSAWAPFVPILFVGLSFGSYSASQAGAIAIITGLFIAGGSGALNLALFVVLPSGFLVNRLTSYKISASGKRQWLPPLQAISELTLIAAGLFMFFAIATSYEHKNGLQDILKASLTFDLKDIDPDVAEEMRMITTEWNFLLLAAVAWIWVLTTWFMAVIVNHVLVKRNQALRHDIALTPFGTPFLFPALLGVAAALAIIGQENDNFAGKTVFLIFLLPYFVSGMVRIHAMSHYWQPRALWLFLIYVILIFLFWSAALVAAMGLYYHLFEMLDKRQKIR